MGEQKKKVRRQAGTMRIAIVEDEERDMARLRDEVETYAEEHELSVEVDSFFSGKEFVQTFKPAKYDLVFFDNYIGSGLGIDYARTVRAMDEKVEFVFVTMSPEFAVSSFDVRALHYLIKPITAEGIAQVFHRLWNFTPKVKEPVIEVMSDYRPVMIPVASVRYINVADKTCVIHGADNVSVYMQLDKLMELFPPDEIVRTHRSYAVRLDAIKSMKPIAFILKDGTEVPIGRSFQADCKSAYIEYLAAKRAGNK